MERTKLPILWPGGEKRATGTRGQGPGRPVTFNIVTVGKYPLAILLTGR